MSKVDTNHPDLETLLKRVYDGEVVIPDFQRSFVWDPEAVRELLVSIVAGYYVGALMSLNVQRTKSPFALKLIEGVEHVNAKSKIRSLVEVILDGQQRISSLFYAFYQPSIGLRNQKNPYYYFIDINKALKGGDFFDDSVIGISSNHKNKLNELRNDKAIIEFNKLNDTVYIHERFAKHKKIREILQLIKSINGYELTIIELPNNTELGRIVETFERINRTGKPLTIFELLTARLYLRKIKLRELLEEAYQNAPLLKQFEPETILRVICLLRNKEPNKNSILKKMDPKDFISDWSRACSALILCHNKLTNIKTGYGIIDISKWMPYNSMIVPLAALLQHLKETKTDNQNNFAKLDFWYWRSIFNESYEQSSNTVSFQDYKDMLIFFKDKTKMPKTIEDFKISTIDFSVDSQGAAIYRGLICMIVKNGAYDFITGQEPKFEPDKIQDDHIFPKKIFKENSILNRTLITTNQRKSKKRPSHFFKDLIKTHTQDGLEKILKSHIISKNSLKFLLNDDLTNFMKLRKDFLEEEVNKLTQL